MLFLALEDREVPDAAHSKQLNPAPGLTPWKTNVGAQSFTCVRREATVFSSPATRDSRLSLEEGLGAGASFLGRGIKSERDYANVSFLDERIILPSPTPASK